MKLGLIPKPAKTGQEGDFDDNTSMTNEERESVMKDLGFTIPSKNLDSFNEEMERMKEENKLELQKEKLKQFTKNEINSLRKAGMTIEQIVELEDPSVNPFKNFSLADREDVSDFLEAQKKFHANVQQAYREEQLADLEVKFASLTEEERLKKLEDPDMKDRSKRKQL